MSALRLFSEPPPPTSHREQLGHIWDTSYRLCVEFFFANVDRVKLLWPPFFPQGPPGLSAHLPGVPKACRVWGLGGMWVPAAGRGGRLCFQAHIRV